MDELRSLFSQHSPEQIQMALNQARGDKNMAASILCNMPPSNGQQTGFVQQFGQGGTQYPPLSSPPPVPYAPNPAPQQQAASDERQIQIMCGQCRNTFPVVVRGRGAVSNAQVKCTACQAVNLFSIPAQEAPTVPPPAGMAHPQQTEINHGPPRLTGTQRALLIGINYPGTPAELRGCHGDVQNMSGLLSQQYGWRFDQMKVLMDDGAHAMPTRRNIIDSMRWLTQGARPGDVLFFHFSGHGTQRPDEEGLEEDGLNECILPCDVKKAGLISDDEVFNILVAPLPDGVRLTAVFDCCHSGTGMDLPWKWEVQNGGWREETNPFHTRGDVQMFSGCHDDQTAADSAGRGSIRPGGAMTTAFCNTLRAHPCPNYTDLIRFLQEEMRRQGFRQRPQLSSSQAFEIQRPFLLHDIRPNSNRVIGRQIRRRFKPRKPKKIPELDNFLGVGAGLVGLAVVSSLFGAVFD